MRIIRFFIYLNVDAVLVTQEKLTKGWISELNMSLRKCETSTLARLIILSLHTGIKLLNTLKTMIVLRYLVLTCSPY